MFYISCALIYGQDKIAVNLRLLTPRVKVKVEKSFSTLQIYVHHRGEENTLPMISAFLQKHSAAVL